jgi:hypothetical protein
MINMIKMKKYIIITLYVLSGIIFTACDKWLDVYPQTEKTKDKLFETQNGFRSALTGAYIRLKGSSLYGGALTWGDIEYMACNWYNTSSANTTLNSLLKCDYTNEGVISKMDAIYQNLYKTIADVNSILEEIDNKKSVFSAGNYEMIKGEALNIRAFCHFDVLRLFGPVPSDVGTDELFPYVKEVNNDIHPSITYAEFVKNILQDLDEAETLLKDVDPITTYSLSDLKNMTGDFTTDDDYNSYRNVRMNYYATLALKARVYMWLSAQDETNKENAKKYAQMVIDAKDHQGNPTFRLGTENDRVAGDYTFSSEHIMALSVYDLATIATNNFGDNGPYVRYDFSIQNGFYYLNNLFPPSERIADVRWNDMWTYRTKAGETNYVMYKKYDQEKDKVLQVPLLRLSEMYLIETECSGTKEEAETWYKEYCSKKGIPFTGFSSSDWLSDRDKKMIREYVREFYAEGQTFFTYKRYNVTSLPAYWANPAFTGSHSKYIVPKPLREIEYHNN